MGSHPFFLLLVATFAVCSHARTATPTTNTSYIIGTSDTLVPGTELVIDIYLLDLIGSKLEAKEAGGEPCILDLGVSSEGHLWHRSDWTIDVDKEPKSFHKTLRLLVSSDESRLGKTSELKIESHSCFQFSRSIEVPVVEKDLLVSIRTDKPTYKPGDHVLIETLVLTSELRPHPRPVNLTIHNSKDQVIVRWLNVTSEEGWIRERFLVPLLARPEEWTITLEHHEQNVNHTLEIELPNSPQGKESFEIDVRSPRYHTVHISDETKSPRLDISVAASLESGVPVIGGIELEVSLAGETTLKPMKPLKLETGHKLISLEIEEIKKALGMKTEVSLNGRTVEFHVTVEEDRMPIEKEEEYDGSGTEKPKLESERNMTTESTLEGRENNITTTTRKTLEHEMPKKREDGRPPMRSIKRVVNVTFVDQSHVLFFSEHTPVYFKPGLSYIGQVLLKPIDTRSPSGKEEVEVTVKVKLYPKGSPSPKEEELKLKLKSNSIGEFSVKVPGETVKMELEAVYQDKVSGKSVSAQIPELLPFGSEEGHHLQVTLEQKPPVVHAGESIKVKVETTFSIRSFGYEILCQSAMVLTGTVSLPSPSTSHAFSIEIPLNVSHLLSSPRLVVMAQTPSLEFVSDSLQFVVRNEKEMRPLVLQLKSETVSPGSKVGLSVQGEPSTSVYLLTLSEQIVFEPKEQESRKVEAYENMISYLHYINSTLFTETIEVLCETCSTIPSLAPDSLRVLNETHGLILTDGEFNTDPRKAWPTPSVKNGTLDDLETLSHPPLLEFETKLWRLNWTVGPTGEETVDFVLPEEARLYTIAAFGWIPGKGLVVSENPIQILATSKLLAELRHPESVVRGEEPILELHLFNNQEKEVEVEVIQKPGDGFRLLCMEEKSAEELLSSKLTLKPMETKVLPTPIKTSRTWQKPLEVKLLVKSEGVEIPLNTTVNLRYEGYEVRRPNTTVLDNFEGKQVHLIDITKEISKPIEKSERAVVKIYGHPLGPAIERVCREMNESKIVSERMKMFFLLGVNVLEHISNNSLFENSGEMEFNNNEHHNWPINVTIESSVNRDECIESVRDVLEYMLEKTNPDGSVNFHRSEPGYIWLTMMILEANLQLKNVRLLDEEKIIKTIEWLLEHQQSDGSYVEDKSVNELRSPSTSKSPVPLTSQVISTLLEASETLTLPVDITGKIKSTMEKGIKFVLDKITSGELDKDAYSLNVAAYALALAKNDKIFDVLVKRNRLITLEGGYPHWKVELENKLTEEENSLSVEATSYGILTYLVLNDLQGAGSFVEFITSQMRPCGKFVTTQDTNVAMKALSRFYRQLDTYHIHERVNVEVNITLPGKESASLRILDPFFVGKMYFDNSNLTLGSSVKVESSGNGLILVQSDVTYNEPSPSSKPTEFDLKLEVRTIEPERLGLKVCAINLKGDESPYFIGEVPLLSGYELNLEELKPDSDSQVYKENDVVYLLFHKVEQTTPKCVELVMERILMVSNLEERMVRLYPISDPDMSVYQPYSGPKWDSEQGKMCPK